MFLAVKGLESNHESRFISIGMDWIFSSPTQILTMPTFCSCRGGPIKRNRSYRQLDYCSKSKNECPYGIDRIFHLDNMKGKLVRERQTLESSLANPKVYLCTAETVEDLRSKPGAHHIQTWKTLTATPLLISEIFSKTGVKINSYPRMQQKFMWSHMRTTSFTKVRHLLNITKAGGINKRQVPVDQRWDNAIHSFNNLEQRDNVTAKIVYTDLRKLWQVFCQLNDQGQGLCSLQRRANCTISLHRRTVNIISF